MLRIRKTIFRDRSSTIFRSVPHPDYYKKMTNLDIKTCIRFPLQKVGSIMPSNFFCCLLMSVM